MVRQRNGKGAWYSGWCVSIGRALVTPHVMTCAACMGRGVAKSYRAWVAHGQRVSGVAVRLRALPQEAALIRRRARRLLRINNVHQTTVPLTARCRGAPLPCRGPISVRMKSETRNYRPPWKIDGVRRKVTIIAAPEGLTDRCASSAYVCMSIASSLMPAALHLMSGVRCVAMTTMCTLKMLLAKLWLLHGAMITCQLMMYGNIFYIFFNCHVSNTNPALGVFHGMIITGNTISVWRNLSIF